MTLEETLIWRGETFTVALGRMVKAFLVIHHEYGVHGWGCLHGPRERRWDGFPLRGGVGNYWRELAHPCMYMLSEVSREIV